MKARDTPAMKSRCLKHSGNSAKVRTLHSRPLAKLATRLRSGGVLGVAAGLQEGIEFNFG